MATDDDKMPGELTSSRPVDEAGRAKTRNARASSRRLTSWTNEPIETVQLPANVARIDTHPIHRQVPRRNPTDFTISLRAKGSTDQQLHRPGERRQSMRGFEDHYTDIVDYIVRATHRAWEEKDIGYVYDFYKHNAVIRAESGMAFGRDQVIANSIGLMNAFPDMRWLAGEVIWSGDDDVGFHTSHRGLFIGTNTGWSAFGPPTGRRCAFWAMANCITVSNEIYDEYVIENTASMIQQLGLDVRDVARRTAAEIDVDAYAKVNFGEPTRLLGQGKPEHMPPAPDAFDPEDFVRRMFHYVWNWRMVGMTRDFFAPNIRAFGPVERASYNLGDYQANVMARLATFPDLALSVDDVYWMGNEVEGYMVAVRWGMVGTHRGWGIYGKPTNRRVHLWGMSHFDVRGGRIVEEWTMFNEFSVLQQILREDPLPV